MATDPAVQAALEVLSTSHYLSMDLKRAELVVAAVTPLIRAQAFTEAAEAIEALRNGFKPSDFIGEQMPGWIQGLIDAEEVVREARAVSDGN